MKYSGSCHCEAVKFAVEASLEKVISCNCSHCAMKGLLLVFLPESQFTLQAGENTLTEYLFNKKTIRHLFCKTCGVQPIGRSQGKEGQNMVAVNVHCLKEVDIEKLNVVPYNGKDL